MDHKFQSHGDNILKKLHDPLVKNSPTLFAVITKIKTEYDKWAQMNLQVDTTDSTEEQKVEEKTRLFDNYRNILDEEAVDAFDSRGALQPSALEEFCYYLLKPLIAEDHDQLAIGHHLVYQSLYFTSPNFKEFKKFPNPNYPVNNLDFIIGKKINSTLATTDSASETPIYLPAVAIECKTYLDRPRFIESDIMAKNIKIGFPSCLYIVLSEFLKLDLEAVNVYTSEIDKIYVIRRKHNIDRKIRRAKGLPLPPIHTPAVLDLYNTVKKHLTEDWSTLTAFETGILKS